MCPTAPAPVNQGVANVTLKRTVKVILNRQTETKYLDAVEENVQLYHNIGYSPVVPAIDFEGSMSTFFNP
jgi:hypothetical protein